MKSPVVALIAILALTAIAGTIAVAWLGTRPADPAAAPAGQAEALPTGATPDLRSASAEEDPTARAEIEAPAPAPEVAAIVQQAVLTGRVVDPRRLPLAAVEVRLDAWLGRTRDERPLARAESGDDGRFRLALDLPVEEHLRRGHLIVVTDRYAPLERELVLAAGAQDLGELVLGDAGRVAGLVLGPGGVPVEGLRVVTLPLALAHQANLLVGPRDVDGETTSDAQGRFAMTGVPVGPHLVGAGGGEWAWSYERDVEVRAGADGRDVVLRLERLPDERWIELVVVTPAGEPVPRARIEAAYRSRERSGSVTDFADEQGRYRLRLAVLCPHSFTAHDPDGRLGPARVEDIQPGARGLVLRLTERRSLELYVHDEAGAPVEDFRAWAWNVGRSRHQLAFADSPPHPGGRAAMTLPAEPFEIELEAEGFARPDLGVIDPRVAPETLEVVLQRVPGVRGVVLHQGEPLAGARVMLLRSELGRIYSVNAFPARSRSMPQAQARSESDGSFRLTLRESGEWFVRAEADDLAPAELGPLRIDAAQGASGIELSLGPGGAIEGRLLLPPGESPAGAIVGVSRGDGFAVTRRTDVEGRYRFERLTPGRWLVRRCAEEILPGHTSSSGSSGDPGELPWSCEVLEGGLTRFDLDLAAGPPVLLEGGLLLAGAPAAGWTARLTSTTHWQKSAEATLDEYGRFRLALDEAGAHRLRLSAPDSQAPLSFQATLTLVEGRNVFERSVDLGALAGLVGTPPQGSQERIRAAWSQDGLTYLGFLPLGPDGTYRLDPVPAGELSLRTWKPGQEPVELGRVVVPAGGEARLDLP